jgi:hypothetical protein
MFGLISAIQCLSPDKDHLICDEDLMGTFGPNIQVGTRMRGFSLFEAMGIGRLWALFFSFVKRSIVVEAAILLCANPAWATPAYVQGNYAVPQTAQTSVQVTYTGTQTVGDLNLVIVGWADTTAQISSVTDTNGNVYRLAVGPAGANGVASESIYYATNIVAATAGTNAVKVTFSVPATYPDIRILEYSGIDPANPVDAVAAAEAAAATSSTATVTTHYPNDLLVAANDVETHALGSGTGFTLRMITSPDGDEVEDSIVGASGSYTASAPLVGNGGWVMQVVALRSDSGTPTPSPSPKPVSSTVSPAYVQGNYATPRTPQSQVQIAYNGAQTSGDLNVVMVGWANTAAQVNSVTDTHGNVYQLAVGPTEASGDVALQAIYYAKNVTAGGANVVTVTFSVPVSYPDIRILEYSGIDPVNPVDVAASAPGIGATSSTATVATKNATDLLVAGNDVATHTLGPGTGFTQRMITSPNGDIVEDRTVTALGAYSASAPLFGNDGWVMQMVAFRAASTTTTPTPTGSVNLAWNADAATTNPGTNTVGYRLHTGSISGTYTQTTTLGNTTTATVSNLKSGSTYYFVVTAYNSAGVDSPYSNEVSYKAP